MSRAAPAAVLLMAALASAAAAAPVQRSIPELKRDLARAQAAGDQRGEAALLDQLAEANLRNGDWIALLDYAQRALARNPAPDDRSRGRYEVRRCMGLLELREIDSAEQSCRAALELARAGIEQALVVHFATHGLVDEEHPERSGLALTPAPGSDGILQMREIYRLHLAADLVTLSACRTAVGRELTGEGVMGLGRAFLYAGAGAVMASLWNVNDASTSAFMAGFYRHLRQGRTVAEAAREARLALLRDRRWSHPYYWAPFVVTGNAAVAVPLSRRRGWPWWPMALVAACGTAGSLAFARRRRVIPAPRVR